MLFSCLFEEGYLGLPGYTHMNLWLIGGLTCIDSRDSLVKASVLLVPFQISFQRHQDLLPKYPWVEKF